MAVEGAKPERRIFKPYAKISDHSSAEELLSFEETRSERLRTRAVLVIFVGLTLIACVCAVSGIATNPVAVRILGGSFPIGPITIVTGAMTLYELFAYRLLSVFVARRVRVAPGPRIVNILGEIAFVTAVLWILARRLSPEVALDSPATFIYFPFIVLSVLRMRFAFPLATGILGAASLAGLGMGFFPPGRADVDFFTALMPIVGKAALILLTGAVAGFVADQLRKRIENVLKLTDERERVVSIFGQYISSSVVDKLLSQRTEFEGETREVALMFLDIRGFTKFSGNRDPREVVEFLNIFFGEIIPIVNDRHGIVNKFLGDGFMAVFGAPLSDGSDAHNAVLAGLDICGAVDRLNAEGRIEAVRIGIGLHWGQAVTGTVGSMDRKEYTIIGDTVNLASRIESLNKEFGSTFLISSAVESVVRGTVSAEPMPPVLVKGKDEPVHVFKVL